MSQSDASLPKPKYKNLTLRYISVLVVLAILATLIFGISYSVTHEQHKDAELIKVSGQQRTLALDAELLGERIVHAEDEERQREYQQSLKAVLSEIEQTHTYLSTGKLAGRPTIAVPPDVHDVFFATRFGLDRQMSDFIGHGQALSNVQGMISRSRNTDLASIQVMAPVLDVELSRVVSLYNKETDRKIAKLKSVQWAGLFSMLAILLASALFVFRPMVNNIRTSFQRLQVLHEKLSIRNIELEMAKDKFENQGMELVELSEDLVEARNTAEVAQKTMARFMSSMSHELRTPLNAIIGFAQLMEHDTRSPLTKEQQDNVIIIKQSGDHLLNMINEVLDLSKIEAGVLTIGDGTVFLAQVMEDCCNLVRVQADKAGIALEHEPFDLDIPNVRGDGVRVKQVLLNFLTNAIKYNRPNGRVTLAWDVEHDGVKITVTDTGVGLKPDQLETLFQPYARAGAEKTTVEGTGLGLVISKKLIELMGGRVGVKSTQGEGSEFWFVLPQDTSELGEDSPPSN